MAHKSHIRLITIDGEQVAPLPHRAPDQDKRDLREIYIRMAESHMADVEKAILVAARHLSIGRLYLEDLKTLEGFEGPTQGQRSVAFSDHPFLEEHELAIIPKTPKRERWPARGSPCPV